MSTSGYGIIVFTDVVLFCSVSIITFTGGNKNSTGVVWLCFGSMFLCLGTTLSGKSRENENNDENGESEDK